MLGETKGTSAGGKTEAGKFLRVPGTNPFFMRPTHAGQPAGRADHSMDYDFGVYLNTGRVGGGDHASGRRRSRSRTPPRSSRRSPRAPSPGSRTPTSATSSPPRFPTSTTPNCGAAQAVRAAGPRRRVPRRPSGYALKAERREYMGQARGPGRPGSSSPSHKPAHATDQRRLKPQAGGRPRQCDEVPPAPPPARPRLRPTTPRHRHVAAPPRDGDRPPGACGHPCLTPDQASRHHTWQGLRRSPSCGR